MYYYSIVCYVVLCYSALHYVCYVWLCVCVFTHCVTAKLRYTSWNKPRKHEHSLGLTAQWPKDSRVRTMQGSIRCVQAMVADCLCGSVVYVVWSPLITCSLQT